MHASKELNNGTDHVPTMSGLKDSDTKIRIW